MPKSKKQEVYDNSFYKLAAEITSALERNKDGTIQEQQVEELMEAERLFKESILRYRQSEKIYKKFLQKITVENRNILSARPYFREPSSMFSEFITPAIKTSNIRELKKFNINYQLIKFIKENWLGPFPEKSQEFFNRVFKARTILIENNMPLAVNRAKLFYRKTPKSHLTLMDFIGICSMGLAAGIDKWCGKYSPVFRSVCIGRMVGNMIDSYSETMLHFYPSDKRILYKAHTIRGRKGIDEVTDLTDAVNKAFKEDEKEGKSIPKEEVNVSGLSSLMNAASTVSADATTNEEGFGVYTYTQDENQDLEGSYIEKEATERMLHCTKDLPILHKKILILKGVKI
jgi:hypothetical protein